MKETGVTGQPRRLVLFAAIAGVSALAIATAVLRVPSFLYGEPLSFDRLPSPAIVTPTAQDETGQTVRVYFLVEGGDLDPQNRANYRAVSRTVGAEPTTEALLEAALRELLKGPTDEERSQGVGPNMFSSDTANLLGSVAYEEGEATVDLNDWREIIPQAGTSTGQVIFTRQLTYTIFELSEIERIVYQLEGSCDEFWESLESVCRPIIRSEYQP